MKDNIFRRVEEKYLLNEEELNDLLTMISSYIDKDYYYESKICSIYFDNDNNDLVINSMEKPIYKDKVRLRSYGIPNLKDNVYLEIKNKYKGVVGKRRIKLKLEDYYDYIDNNCYKDNQIMKEIDYLFNYYQLRPSIFIAYDRKSYKGKDDENLRITFDTNLRSRKGHLELDYGDQGEMFFKEKCYIMEIKTLGSMPLWLVRSLSELKLYPTSFSKYGNIYKKYCLEGGR